jgi:hypothetical protein
MKLERYGENVKRDAIKYAMAHLNIFRYSSGTVGRRCNENHRGEDGSSTDERVIMELVESESYSSELSSCGEFIQKSGCLGISAVGDWLCTSTLRKGSVASWLIKLLPRADLMVPPV